MFKRTINAKPKAHSGIFKRTLNEAPKTENSQTFTCVLDQNIDILKQILKDDETIIYKILEDQDKKRVRCCIVFSSPISSEQTINDKIISPIMEKLLHKKIGDSEMMEYLTNEVITCRDIMQSANSNVVIDCLLRGDTIILVDGIEEAVITNTRKTKERDIKEPETERIIRGPREGFTEAIQTNLSLIRKRIVDPSLKFKFMDLGTITKTTICICYLDGTANKKILEELYKRLNKINIDGILDTNYIEELIMDAPLSPFKTIASTERPDVVVAKILEGRIALICDGTPIVLTLPFIFIEHFQSDEDYYTIYIQASINRLLRIGAYFITISLPAMYQAIVAFHQEMIPTPLLLSISGARESVPFPTLVEMILLLAAFELLKEAGIRMPLQIGQAISIVGALILGQASVDARIVSAPIIIVAALTGITSYLIPRLKSSIILTRLVLLLLAAFLGFYGFIIGIIALFIYLMSIRSFGIPYMLDSSLVDVKDIKDTAIRAPWWSMRYRPNLIATNPVRKAGKMSSGKGKGK